MMDFTTDTGRRVDARLREEEIIWLTTTRSDNGQPQSVPVWFLWDGQAFYVRSQSEQRKVRNIRDNPRVSLNLNSNPQGGDIVSVEGEAEALEEFPSEELMEAYLRKYREGIARLGLDAEGMARSYATTIRVAPTRWQVW
jgi:PPOX class probable F420-dependent enzyme